MHFNIIFLIFFIFSIQQTLTQNPPVVPLTNALTAVYCHNLNEIGTMTIRCGTNEKIRMLDAFDVVVKNQSHLPLQCLQQKPFSVVHGDISNNADCKVHTSFASACSGRENCTLHMQRIRLNSVTNPCHNEIVDYTMAFFECISDVFIHDICSTQAITSSWGTLQTPNFPNPYTSNDDCWCKLSTQLQQRLLLSVIIFQLIPYDKKCAGAGLYLQSSNDQRSTQCTYLQPGHNYLSDTNTLYINFYSRTSTVRGGFWIIYEASHSKAEVHLQCGSREKIGVPSTRISITTPAPVSSFYNHGWSRLVYNDPPNPESIPDIHDRLMNMRLFHTTTPSFFNRNFKAKTLSTAASAFTYPYGRLATFDLDFGPRGWFVKYPYGSPNMTVTKFLQTTTTPSPVVKWNSTWLYIRRFRTKVSPRIFITSTTTTTTTTTTTSTVEPTTSESTTIPIPTSTFAITSTEQILSTTPLTIILTTTPQSITTESLVETVQSTIKSTTHPPPSSFTLKTTLPFPTPWYPPAGLFDYWDRLYYTTRFYKASINKISTTQTPISSTTTTTTTTATTPLVTTTRTTTSSTTRHIIHLSNTTRKISVTSTKEVTADWFGWPHTASTKTKSDYYDDDYSDWFGYLPTNRHHNTLKATTARNPFLPILSEPQRKQYQQMSLLSTKSNWNMINMDATASTLLSSSSKLSYTQQNTDSEGMTHTDRQNISQEQPKKISEEYGWFSKTDMTIVGVAILFVVLLVFINLILFAVRRHRHRVQNQHLLCASLPSSFNDRSISNNQLQSSKLGDSTNSLINITNNNNNDILPAVGEIVLWDEKDQGGYMIDNHGEWAKIEGRQWLGSNLAKSQNRSSFSKSFRSRFQFIRQSYKKSSPQRPPAPLTPKLPPKQQHHQTSKFPLLMDTATLSPVPEADDYQTSDFSATDVINRNSDTKLRNSNKKHQQTTKTIQALIHTEQDHSDEYYKRIDSGGDDSNYTAMLENHQGEYSIADQQTDRCLGNEIDVGDSVIISVPTMLRQEDDIDMTTDGAESMYNQNYSIRSHNEFKRSNLSVKSTKIMKPIINNSIVVGHCQIDCQPLNPKLLEKSSLAEHQQLYTYSQSLQLSAYDSGFFDDQTTDSAILTPRHEQIGSDEISSNQSRASLSRQDTKLAKTYC